MAVFKYKKKYVNGIDYDKNRDYSKEIKEAKKTGDTAYLSRLEEERNKKIEGENLPYRKTYDYIDIGTKIEDGIRNKENPYVIKEYVEARRDKAKQNSELDRYKSDEIQKKGLKYYYDLISGAGENYENRPKWDDVYEERINALLEKIEKAKAFEYNLDEDSVYQTLKEKFESFSKRASEDTLSNLSQSAGGVNSYAIASATMAANDYNEKLAEEIPKLYQFAYERYLKENEIDMDKLESLIKAQESARDVYESDINQYNKDRQFARDSADYDIKVMMEEDKFKEDQKNKARELISEYEEKGIPATDELLKEAKMESFKNNNIESASVFKEKLDLEAIKKAREIEKLNKSINKTVDKDKDKDNPENEPFKSVVNEKTEKGMIIDGEELTYDEIRALIQSGRIISEIRGDGKFEYKFKK